MKTIHSLFAFFLSNVLCASFAFSDTAHHLVTVNPELAKAAIFSYREGHFRYIQSGQLIEASDVDDAIPSCILETGKMLFNTEAAYLLESTRSLDVDGEQGEIELNFETQSSDPESYFQIYCFQSTSGATLDTAREAMKTVFEIN